MAYTRKKREKHPSALLTIRTTKAQREALSRIRLLLAEQGYQIFPVAIWYRRSRHDFLAVLRGHPQQMLLVRPDKRRAVELRPYVQRSLYHHTQEHLQAHRDICGRMVWGRQLPARKNRGSAWRQFISRNCSLELKLFALP